MEYRKQAKAAMNEKISRMTGGGDAVGVDASDWRPAEPLDADVKTGMRPISRRQYKRGGKVDVKAEGNMASKRADRAKRKDGGKAIADAIVNRDQKSANQEREGKKHIGAMKKGGRVERKHGGKNLGLNLNAPAPLSTNTNMGLGLSAPRQGFLKRGGRAGKDLGGGIPGGGSDIVPSGSGTKSMMRQIATNGFKKGGRTKKMGGGILTPAHGPAIPAGAPSTLRAPTMPMMPQARPGAMPVARPPVVGGGGAPMVGATPLKRGGRAKKAAGGAERDMNPKPTSAEQLRRMNDIMQKMGRDPYGEDDSAVTMDDPQVQRQGKGDRELPRSADPFEDRPAVEGMDSPPYANGGGVENDLGTAVGHAIAAYHRAQSRHARKSGGRVGKAMGGGFGEDMNNPKPKAEGKGKRGGPNINITINTAPKLPPLPLGGPPMPPPGPGAGMPPGMAPDMGPPPGAPPEGLGVAPPMPPGGMPPGMPPKPPFKRGGAVKMHAGAGSGEGRLEKAEKYGRNAHAKGGKVGMTAGAGSGEGRLEKVEAYGSKA